jgi:hypothetical protein
MLKNFVKEFQNNSPSLRQLRSRRILEPTEVNGTIKTTKATSQCKINSNIDKPKILVSSTVATNRDSFDINSQVTTFNSTSVIDEEDETALSNNNDDDIDEF